MDPLEPQTLAAWQLFTRLGEMQLLLPAAAAVLLLMLSQPGQRSRALHWLARLSAAALLTTATKLAFIGWGIGSAALDFTGISGHALFASATHPLLLAALVSAVWSGRTPKAWSNAWRLGALAGMALGGAVAVSRVVVDAHSVSEAVAGVLVGGWVGLLVLRMQPLPAAPVRWLAPLVALWLVAAPLVAPASQSHALVTRLALALSGQSRPYTRDMLRAVRTSQAAPTVSSNAMLNGRVR
jgi:membrane-associated phospholipid phosphatase